MIQVQLKKLHKDAKIPVKSTTYAACYDVFYCGTDFFLYDDTCIGTGLAMAIPEGYCVKLFPRSGMARNYGVKLVNCVAIIDSDYRDELQVLLSQPYDIGGLLIQNGDKICQMSIEKVEESEFIFVDELPKSNSNREGGFGSTGR